MSFKNSFFENWANELDTSIACIKYRAKHGLTEKAMAQLCGISHPTLRKIERGQSVNPTILMQVINKIKEV